MIEDFLLDLHTRNYSPATIRSYGHTFSCLAKFASGNLEEMTASDLRQFLRSKGEMAPATRMRHLGAMRSLGRFFERQGKPCPFALAAKALQGPKQAARVPRALSEDEALRLISAASRPRNTIPGWQVTRLRAAVMILYGAGLRAAELLNLPFELDRDMVRVTGKGRKERLVPFLPAVQQAVETFKAAYLQEHAKPKLLFADYSDRQLRRDLQMLRGEANLSSKTSPHSLRHSFATHIYQNGGDIRVLADVLGHESVRTTAIYMNADAKHLLKVVENCFPNKYSNKPE